LSIQTEILTSRVAEETKDANKTKTRRSDHELQLVRRIDWRFLLPEPYLRRVAYFGPANGALPSALEHFSESFQNISSPKKAKFDLVVLSWRDAPDLEKAHTLLAPGGFLYWEMKPISFAVAWRRLINREADTSHATSKCWRWVLNLFGDHIDALERLGFSDIQLHWHRPNFEACLEMIPMNEPVLDYTFSRTRSDLASRLKFAAGRVMMQSGLLAHLTPCFSLVAQKV
jgi:hypothetical protein